jgi:hypothetical protein
VAGPYREIYEALRARLDGRRPRRDIWRDLVNSGYVTAVAHDRWTLERLLDLYRLKEETYHPPRRARQPAPQREIGPDEHSLALSELVTLTVDDLFPAGRKYRERFLPGGLQPDQIAAWIEAQLQREGSPAPSYMVVPLAKEHSYRPWPADLQHRADYADWLAVEAERVRSDAHAELPRGWVEEQLSLRYFTAAGKIAEVKIRGDGVLAQLKYIALTLSNPNLFAGWSEEQALAYILADTLPRLPRARATVRWAQVPAATRIDLEVNPRLAPQEVADLYAQLRRGLGKERDREMDEKHLNLALLAQQSLWSGSLAGLSWSQRRERWNERYPQRSYPTEDPAARAFAMAARNAWVRLSGRQWPRARRRQGSRQVGWGRLGGTWY